MKRTLSTLCYIEREGQYLMLHRVKKENDLNKDKWIGVGGHFEGDEMPEGAPDRSHPAQPPSRGRCAVRRTGHPYQWKCRVPRSAGCCWAS